MKKGKKKKKKIKKIKKKIKKNRCAGSSEFYLQPTPPLSVWLGVL